MTIGRFFELWKIIIVHFLDTVYNIAEHFPAGVDPFLANVLCRYFVLFTSPLL